MNIHCSIETDQAALRTFDRARGRMAIGAAAISTLGNLATWLLPIGFGAMKDATHSYTAGLWLMPLCNVLALVAALPLWAMVKAGKSLDDKDIVSMNWYVKGIDDQLPQ